MAVRHTGKQWVVEFMLKGHRVFKRLPDFATKADALAYEAKLRQQVFQQAHLGQRPEVTIHAAITEWLKNDRKSVSQTASHAKQTSDAVGHYSLGSLVDAAARLRREAASKGLSAATVNRRLCVLKAAGKYAYKQGWTEENLSARIGLLPEGPPRQTYLTHEEVAQLISKTPDRAKPYVAIAVYTGLRQSQVLSLTPENVVGGSIRLADSKTGVPLAIPVVDALKPFLKALPLTLHKRTYYSDFETGREGIGKPRLRYHDLRHTTASLMIQSGVPLYTVGEILGHKSVQTTKRYAHLSMENKRDALEAAFTSKFPSKKRKSLTR